MDTKAIDADVKIVSSYCSWMELDESTIKHKVEALRRLRINLKMLFRHAIYGHDLFKAVVEILKNQKLSEEIHAEAAWLIATTFPGMSQDFYDEFCHETRGFQVLEVLANLITAKKKRKISPKVKLHCMWALGKIVSVWSDSRRHVISSTFVLRYLAQAYRKGLVDEIKDPEYGGAFTGNVFEDYSFFLYQFCLLKPLPTTNDLALWKSVICILADIITKFPSNRRILGHCLNAIEGCRPHLADRGWHLPKAMFEILLEVLKAEMAISERNQDGLWKKCFSTACAYASEIGPSMSTELGSLCLQAFCRESREDLWESVGEFLNQCQTNSSERLLSTLQFVYQKHARSLDAKSKRYAELIAQRMDEKKIDYIGGGAAYDPSFQSDELLNLLEEFTPMEFHVSDVFQLICKFAANETYRRTQLIDVQEDSPRKKWCIAEIIAVDTCGRVQIHIVTEKESSNQWIQLPSPRIAPAFTYTALELDTSEDFRPDRYEDFSKTMVDRADLNVSSLEHALELHRKFHHDAQFAFGHARWMKEKL